MNKYVKRIRYVNLDVYDVLVAFNVTNPGLQHAIKKLLMPGQRGNKTATDDMVEAIAAIERAIEIEQEEIKRKMPPPPPLPGNKGDI